MVCKELLIISLIFLLGNNIQAKRPIKKVLELVKEIRYDMVDEIVDALAPLLNNCGGGVDVSDGQQGMQNLQFWDNRDKYVKLGTKSHLL